MLRKNKPVPFVHPMGTMKRCLDCVNDGVLYTHEIIAVTKLREGQVRAALYNLVFIGAIKRTKDKEGNSMYRIPGYVEVTADCWSMASSVFSPLPVCKIHATNNLKDSYGRSNQ